MAANCSNKLLLQKHVWVLSLFRLLWNGKVVLDVIIDQKMVHRPVLNEVDLLIGSEVDHIYVLPPGLMLHLSDPVLLPPRCYRLFEVDLNITDELRTPHKLRDYAT